MCYSGTFFTSRKVRTAKKDVKAVKFGIMVDGVVKPYFYASTGIEYKEGKKYTSKLDIKELDLDFLSKTIEVEAGLHSYNKRLTNIRVYADGNACVNSLLNPFSGNWYHVWNGYNENLVLIECHIPKGSKYLININGEMVSDTLTVDKITCYPF